MTTTAEHPTATAPPPGAVAEFRIPLAKGCYIARIAGPHGRYGLDREFLEGQTNKRAGHVTHQLEPGFYEYQPPPRHGKRQPRELITVDAAGQIETVGPIPTDRDALRALGKAGRRGDTIDQPGAYAGRVCWCGAEAIKPDPEHGKHQGRARCADHYPPPPGEAPAGPVYDPEPDTDYSRHLEEPPDTVPAEWLEEWHRDEENHR